MSWIFVLILNLFLGYFEARVAGRNWVELNHIGGFYKFFSWFSATHSAICFTIVYAIIIFNLGIYQDWWPQEFLNYEDAFRQYAIIIPFLSVFFSFMVLSWEKNFRDEKIVGLAWSARNTLITAHQMVLEVSAFTHAAVLFKDMTNAVVGKNISLSSRSVGLGLFLLKLSLLLGVITTSIIITHYSGTIKLPKDVSNA